MKSSQPTASFPLEVLKQLDLTPVRFWLPDVSALEETLNRFLPGLQGEQLASAVVSVKQLALGLNESVTVEWTMYKPKPKHLKARLTVERASGAPSASFDDPLWMAGYIEDRTEEVEREEALREEVLTLNAWLAALPDAVVVVRNGAVDTFNDEAQRVMGDRLQAGVPILGLAQAEHHSVLASHARSGAQTEPTIVSLVHDPSRHVEITSRDLPTSPGVRLLVLRDVSARMKAELRAAAAERLASVGRLAAGVAHEINNPLAYVTMNLELLQEDVQRMVLPPPLEEDINRKLDDAMTGAARVNEIVSQLRVFANARTSQNVGGRLPEAVDLAQQLSRFAMQGSVQVQVSLASDLPKVNMGVGGLSQVLINLMVNASDAMEEAGVESRVIAIEAQQVTSGVMLDVSDSGPGIPAAHAASIFEPYFTTKEAGKGTGMGLAIVASLIHEVGGTIRLVRSKVGARFRIFLPLFAQTERLEEETSEMPVLGRRRRMLLIDDEPALVRALSNRLKDLFDVTTANNGQQAKQIIESGFEPDVILCDVEMPRMDGHSFHDWLGSYSPRLQARMVVMTGGTLNPARADFLRDCKQVVLTTPLDMAKLRATVSSIS